MIATLKVLGLKAPDFTAIAAAARRVVDYVRGTRDARQPDGGYYAGSRDGDAAGAAAGLTRGTVAALVGLHGEVSPDQLTRVLSGQHARTGQWLLPATGSAGRATARLPQQPPLTDDLPDVLPLEDAAKLVGVSPQYLRRVAQDSALALLADSHTDDRNKHAGLQAWRDSDTGRWLVHRDELSRFVTERDPPTVVMGYDLTCSAPKSVSLLWAFGDADLRADVNAALDAGVEAALAYLERHAAVGTVARRNRPGLGLAVASYRHEISRAEEAHLHVHNVIVNAVPVPVLDDDGQPIRDEQGIARLEWRALDSEVLHTHIKTAGYVGAAALRHELSARRGLRWGPVRNGVAELANFPPALLEAFSTRGSETREEFAQLVDAGFASDAATLAAAQRGSRAAKRVLSDPEVEKIQLRRLAEASWTPERVRHLAASQHRRIDPPTEDEITELFNRLTGPGGLTEHHPTFTQCEVHQQIAAWAADRLDAEGVSALAERFLADPRNVVLAIPPRRRRGRPEPTFTTVDLLETEDSLHALCRQGRVADGGPPRATVPPDLVEEAITVLDRDLHQANGDGRAGLSAEQADLVRVLLACGDLVRPVVGPAGTGKTEAMRAVVHALASAGHTVVGTAHGGRQTEDIHERLGIRSEVVSGWLARLDHAFDPAEIWPAGTVLIMDEASQVSTRDAERLFRYATRTGTVVVCIGDPAQLGSVGAGGWYRHLVATTPDVPTLTTNLRQRDPNLAQVRRALAALRSDLPDHAREALRLLATDGRVRVFDTRADLLAAVVDDWYRERPQPDPHTQTAPASARAALAVPRMMAEHHRDVELLNRAARARLNVDDALTGPCLRVAGREFQVGDEVITLTQEGHTLVPAGRPRRDYVRTGTIGLVTAVQVNPGDPHRQALTVHFPGKGEVRVGWDYLTHAFPDGRDGGLGHAYALTAHKAEGATMDIARPAVTDDTSRAGLYVMLSRARRDLCAYVIRRHDLEANLDDEDWLPILEDTTGPLSRLADHLQRSRTERLAAELDPIAHAAHRLRTTHTLAELANLHRQAATRERADLNPAIIGRAELAAETAIAATAPAQAHPELIARLGPRPGHGPDRHTWDRAVTALAVYQARHQPFVAAHQLGPAPTDRVSAAEQRWQQRRDQAEHLAAQWATQLSAHRQRPRSQGEALPRQRAIAGIHALLDHGWTASALAAELARREEHTARSGAALLDYRVRQLCDQHRIDITHHDLPAPPTLRAEWNHAAKLLHAAQAQHLATQPTRELAAEHRELTRILTATPTQHRDITYDLTADRDTAAAAASQATADLAEGERLLAALTRHTTPDDPALGHGQAETARLRQQLANRQHTLDLAQQRLAASHPTREPEPQAALRDRLQLLDAALARQLDHAAARLAHEPAPYLLAILGRRPTDPSLAEDWDHHAQAIERYRHHTLGLPYGLPAAPPEAIPDEQALGPPPADPAQRRTYDQLRHHQPTLSLGADVP